MGIAAGHFYDSTAFGTLVVVVVGVLTIVATVWVTLRVANSKRRLYYWVSSDTPLITSRQDLSKELKVTYGVHELKSPRVVNVLLVSRGRRDISPQAFNDKPVCLDLGTHIVECVKVTTLPSDRSDPAWTVKDSKLLIGPDLFGMRQKTVFSLLVDGEPPRIVPPKQSMLDVRIKRGDGEVRFSNAASLAVGVFLVVATAVVTSLVTSTAHSWTVWLTLALLVVASLLLALWVNRESRDN